MPQKKILILTASPDDEAKLRTDKEIKAIDKELKRSKNRDQFKLIPELAATPEDLIRVLRDEEPEIVHFCGHGEEKGLVFESESGNAQTVRREALAKLFEKFQDKVKCVLLNACYTRDQAEALNEHIQYVIGMSGQIEDTAAIKFAVNFYATLIAGRSYKDAYDFGRIALDLLGIQDDLLPVFNEKSQPKQSPYIAQETSQNLPTRIHYNNVINAFKSGRVIPFLGPGINFCDGQLISDIQLAEYLENDLGIRTEDLVGSVCPACLVSADAIPASCPVKKACLEEKTVDCLIDSEQALAVASMNLKYFAQYIKLTAGAEEVYQKLEELFEKKSKANKLYKFFATLPRAMKMKGYDLLPYQLLVTTNYDNMLERAFKAAKQPYDLVFYVAEGKDNRGLFQYQPHDENPRSITSHEEVMKTRYPVILKLYGAVNNFVITEEHHINYLVHREIEQLLPTDLLEFLWEKHNILFLGYSSNDAKLRLIVNRLWGEKTLGQKSWMIHNSRCGALDKEFWNQRHVELFDIKLKEYYQELHDKIEDLKTKRSPYVDWEERI